MELESSRVFVKVVQLGSFSKAALLLKMPVSSVSRTISGLEGEVGTKLLTRTTRSLRLTAAGRGFFESCVGPVQLLEDARRSLQGRDSIMAGPIKLTAPEDLGKYVVTPAIASLAREHPDLMFEFNFTDQMVDLVAEGYDLAVRIGPLAPSRLRARKAGAVRMILVASQAYLKNAPPLREPRDLERHSILLFSDEAVPKLQLHSKKSSTTVRVRPRVHGNQMESLLHLAAHHAGVAAVPQFTFENTPSTGLVRVLADWTLGNYTAYIVSPGGADRPARVRLAAERLAETLEKMLS
jgi:LysR family transcriptional regulator for bpeEF and oprC